SPSVPMSCSKKSLNGANTMPLGTPPADVETKTSESEPWQPEHCNDAELNNVLPRSSAEPVVIAVRGGGARCAMKNVKSPTSSWSSLTTSGAPASSVVQLLVSAARLSSVPGMTSSGQP